MWRRWRFRDKLYFPEADPVSSDTSKDVVIVRDGETYCVCLEAPSERNLFTEGRGLCVADSGRTVPGQSVIHGEFDGELLRLVVVGGRVIEAPDDEVGDLIECGQAEGENGVRAAAPEVVTASAPGRIGSPRPGGVGGPVSHPLVIPKGGNRVQTTVVDEVGGCEEVVLRGGDYRGRRDKELPGSKARTSRQEGKEDRLGEGQDYSGKEHEGLGMIGPNVPRARGKAWPWAKALGVEGTTP